MDVMQFISSVNKISLLAFFITVGFLSYEINLLLKEKRKKQTPSIPKFNPTVQAQNLGKKSIVVSEPKVGLRKSSHIMLIFILFVTMFILGGISIFSVLGIKNTSSENNRPKVIIQEVQSKGIKIFDKDWKEIKNLDSGLLNQGDEITVAVDIISDTDIDSARIRINENIWKLDHITTQSNKVYNVFYREYKIGSQESKLKIEAQLHSLKDGWLGD
ncbi:MAG: hypothetical protein HYW86_02325 [Candidatus Roizmanbacteria bacterium]|nr:MAG: hypothetical protein HYW86_02325 [Candidatus Roizmanbacteria bacterium]